MSYPKTIRNWNAFVDGINYFGIVTEGKLPELKIQTAAHRGNMDAPVGVDVGMEAMSAELTFAEWRPELVKAFGTVTRFVMRPAARDITNGAVDGMIATVGGQITGNTFADLKTGNEHPLKLMMDVRYFRFEHNGEELLEIDIEAHKRIVGGVDQLADIRAAMGI